MPASNCGMFQSATRSDQLYLRREESVVHIQTPSFMPSLFTDTMPPQAYRAMEGKSPRVRSIQKSGTVEEGTTACIRSHRLTIWCGPCVT